MTRRATKVVLVPLLLLALCGTTRGDEGGWLVRVENLMKKGRTADLRAEMDAPDFQSVCEDEPALYEVICETDRHVDALTRGDGKAAGEVFDRLAAAATARREGGADSWRAKWSWAAAVSLQQQGRLRRGERPDLELWKQATDLAVEILPIERRQLLEAFALLRWLGRQAAAKGAACEALLGQAETLVKGYEALETNEVLVARMRAQLHLRSAEAWFANRRRKEALEAIAQGRAFVAKAGAAGEDHRKWLGVDDALLVSFARESKLDRKAQYAPREVKAKQGFFTCHAPDSALWRTEHVGADTQVLSVGQTDAEGHLLRQALASCYAHGKVFRAGTGEVRPEDTAGMADFFLTQMDDGSHFDEVTRRKKSHRSKLCKGGPSGHACVVEGIDDEGRPVTITHVVISSKKLGQTFAFRLDDFAMSGDGLEAWTWFLESIDIPD